MNFFDQFGLPPGRAICYSGFRDGQEPGGRCPSYAEVKEDLLLLQQQQWKYLRLYDCDEHAQTVLQVIRQEGLDCKLLLGAYPEAEENNPDCPWGGGVYSAAQLQRNKINNDRKIERLIRMAQEYAGIVCSVSVGNETCVGWTDHAVTPERIMEFVKRVKQQVTQPVSFCENYIPWLDILKPLAAEVDFISIHTYPVWEQKTIEEGLAYTQENYEAVRRLYPEKPVIITEAGWATQSNGRGIPPENANEENQKIYFEVLLNWCRQEKILCYFFEAFDENWKGSSHPQEPEKHWGLFTANRKAKAALKKMAGQL